jgi:protein-S-isoprenylcysteine O-methyltransferase Ste14
MNSEEATMGQLHVGLGKDIPVDPPLFTAGLVGVSLLLWLFLGRRRWMPPVLRHLAVRVTVCAVILSAFLKVTNAAERVLEQSQSGAAFTPVGGIAIGGPFSVSRNPIYVAMVVVILPSVTILLDSVWPLRLTPILFAYLHMVVIPAEEQVLLRHFGSEYVLLLERVPKWVII